MTVSDLAALRRMRQVGSFLRLIARLDVGAAATTSSRPVLHAANHRSLLDLLFAAAAFAHWGQPIRCLVAASYFQKPGLGKLLRDLRCVPVNGRAALNVAQDLLLAGTSVAIMPEGRVVPPEDWNENRVGRPHSGVGRLAIDTGVAVAVAGAAGTEILWPKDRSWPQVRLWSNRTLLTMRTRYLGPIDARHARDATFEIWDAVSECVAEAELARA